MKLAPGRWHPHVHRSLEEMLRSAGERPLATFDWDNTCVTGDIGEAVLEDLDAADGGDRMATYEQMCEDVGKAAAYAWCAYQVAHRHPDEAHALAVKAIRARLADGRMRVRPEIVALIAAMQHLGWDVWIVSASEERLVRAFAHRYGIDADRVIGMRLAAEGGRLLPRLEAHNTFRQGKVDAIDARIGRRPAFAAGDAETDLEMLESARHRLYLDKRGHPEDPIRDALAEKGAWIQTAVGW